MSARVRPSKFDHQPAVALSVQKTSVRGRASAWTTNRFMGRHKRRFCIGRHQIDSLSSFFLQLRESKKKCIQTGYVYSAISGMFDRCEHCRKVSPFNLREISTNASCNIDKLACKSPIVYLLLHFCLNRLR